MPTTDIQKDRILASELVSEIYQILVEKYGRSSFQTLTPASPFIQVLNSLSELSELNFLYIENAISEYISPLFDLLQDFSPQRSNGLRQYGNGVSNTNFFVTIYTILFF